MEVFGARAGLVSLSGPTRRDERVLYAKRSRLLPLLEDVAVGEGTSVEIVAAELMLCDGSIPSPKRKDGISAEVVRPSMKSNAS